MRWYYFDYEDPSPWWVLVFLVCTGAAASDGESFPFGPAFLATVLLFLLWRTLYGVVMTVASWFRR